MTLPMPAWPIWLLSIVMVLFIAISVVLVLTVLIQKPQGGGLGSAFGGGGGSSGQTAFGTKTGDALTILTIGVFVVYLALAIALNFGSKIVSAVEEPAITAPTGTGGAAPADTGTPTTTDPTAPTAPTPSPPLLPPVFSILSTRFVNICRRFE